VLLVQSTEDPVVDPESADLIYQGLSTNRKRLLLIPSARHGILYEGVGETHEKILEFVRQVETAEG
jgi:alpha-beta hydrolase superfamily lysophospholipase